MKKKQKDLAKKILLISMVTFASIFVLLILLVVGFYYWDKHDYEKQYHEAVANCGTEPYVITSSASWVNNGGLDWVISRTKPSDKYQFIKLYQIEGYRCSADDAKKYILSQYPDVPEKDLSIQISD
jgi:hypothetical protein